MANLLTRKEVEEQFGNLILNFDLFYSDTYVFVGQDKLGNIVTMYITSSQITYLDSNASLTISEAIPHFRENLRFLIFDRDFRIIYQD